MFPSFLLPQEEVRPNLAWSQTMSMQTMFVLCIFQMESWLWIFVGIWLKSLKLHLLALEFAIIEQIQMVSFAIPLLLLSMNFHIMMRSIGQPHVDMK